MIIGYVFVSEKDQNIESQMDSLKKSGCERIYEDRGSGPRPARQGLAEALDMLRAGDSLVVWKLDRLGRTVQDILKTVNGIRSRGIVLKSLTESIDTCTILGMAFFYARIVLLKLTMKL